ncbi:MAG: hypothetical protein H0X24_13035 [Ktedonobacterales bacterium]|nr:hypothetical protein [Ktedonobacterales bacterium]
MGILLLPQLQPLGLIWQVLRSPPVLAFFGLLVVVSVRAIHHRIEFACDSTSAYLTGDPIALMVALANMNQQLRFDSKRASMSHPAIEQRWQRLSKLPANAPWADEPIPTRQLTFSYAGRALTQPLVGGHSPAPLPPVPWGVLPADAPERHALDNHPNPPDA